MRICHLCLNGPYNEGWNYQENILPKYHAKLGLEVYQITTPFMWNGTEQVESTDTDYINPSGIRVIRCKPKKAVIGGNRLNTYPQVKKLLEDIVPDILFIHDIQFMDVPVVVAYLKAHPECVAYADSHTDAVNSARNWVSRNLLHKILWKHMAQRLNPVVKKFYGVLPARVDFLVDVYGLPREKCELLVMGADDELVQAAAAEDVRRELRAKHGIKEDDFLIVTGGKIDLFKTQTLLLMEAVHKLNRNNVKLIVFGSVHEDIEAQFNALVDGEKVHYIGWLNANDTYPVFASAELIVFPSRHSVFWEQAVAQGIPLMVRHWDGMTHVDIGGNVVFLHEDSEDLIRRKIEELLLNDNYEKVKKAALSSREQFLYSNIAKKSIEEIS